jgi:hypothetical protein
MILQTKPHPWSCLATSFAMALGITTQEFEARAGHDGGQIVFPGQPEPRCRRGFHISEACLVSLKLGCTATPFEVMPQIAESGTNPAVHGGLNVYYGKLPATNWVYFWAFIQEECGVIECRTLRGNYHAVAFEKNRIFDPDGREFDYSRDACEARGLFTQRLWIVK